MMTPEEKRKKKTEYQRKYRELNKEKYISEYKEYHRNNKEKKSRYYKEKYKPRPRIKKTIEEKREWRRNYEKNKKLTDLNHKLKCNLRNRLKIAMQNNRKNDKTLDLIGCSLEEFRLHLQSQFQPGMTWENWSLHGWHIDHIVPLSAFDLFNPEELKKALHYTNMRPLWAKDNLSKGSKNDWHR